jgi:hypothetical protein
MIHIGPLILMTRKELLDLLVVEKRTSYRRGYKAGAAMRYRHTPETSAQVTDENAMPTVYGDSLPIKGGTAGVTTDPDLTLTAEQ